MKSWAVWRPVKRAKSRNSLDKETQAMQIQFTVTGDDLQAIADELERLASEFRGQVQVEPAAEQAEKPKKAPRKKKAEPEPKPEKPEPVAEEPDDADIAPEEAWQEAVDLLMKYWSENPEEKETVIAVAAEFGVQKFAEIPKEQGNDFLAKAKEVTGG